MVLALLVGSIVNYFQSAYLASYKTEQLEKVKTIKNTDLKAFEKTVDKEVKKYKEKTASYFSILSDIFLRLIKMIIAPLVFAVLVLGVAKVGDFKTVGRIGIKTMVYFTSATLIALALGLVLVNVFEPGKRMPLELPEAGAKTGVESTELTVKSFISHVIPESVIGAMAKNEILPIVVFSLFFGIALAAVGSKGKRIIELMESLSEVMFKVTGYVMSFAPVGVFGALAAVISMQGIGILKGYAILIACFYFGLLLFVFGILNGISRLFGIKFFSLLGFIKEPAILAFSTASSEAAMPKTIIQLEKFGVSNRVVSFVLPLGYSFNLDGSIMYMTFASVFIAQAYGIDLSAGQQITMMLILLLTSKGIAGVPRASLVVIAGTLATFKIPGEGLILLFAVDQLLDMGRSATNVVGNAVASAVVAKWEGELKEPQQV